MRTSNAQPLADGTQPVDAGLRAGTRTWSRPIVFAGAVLAATLGGLLLLRVLAEPLVLLFMAIVIAEALAPIATRLRRWMPRILAILVIYGVLFAVIVSFFLFVVPPLVLEIQKAAVDLPYLFSRAASLINRIAPGEGQRIVSAIQPAIVQMVSGFATSSTGAVSALTAAVEVVFLSIYWLISMPGLKRFALSLVPASTHQPVSTVLDEIGGTMGGYVRGTVINAIIMGIIIYIGLLLLGVKYAVLLAVIAAAGELVPLIGPTIAEALAAGMALLISPERALIVLAFYLILEQIDGNVILPLVVRQQANIPPLLITFAVFTGAWADGVVGALVAIPLAGVVQVLVLRTLVPLIQTWTGAAA